MTHVFAYVSFILVIAALLYLPRGLSKPARTFLKHLRFAWWVSKHGERLLHRHYEHRCVVNLPELYGGKMIMGPDDQLVVFHIRGRRGKEA